MKFLKTHYIKIIIVLILAIFSFGMTCGEDTSENKKLGPEFLKDVIVLKSQKETPALAKQYGFIQETDEEGLDVFENDTIKGTIQTLSVDGLYISLSYPSYEEACAASEAMVKAHLIEPKSFKYQPFWPEQAYLISRWTGQGEQSHVSLNCEQYGDDGSSNVDININFSNLDASE